MRVDLMMDLMDFGALDAGDVFLHKEDLYMKLDVPDSADDNAVDLEDGSLHAFKKDKSITHFPGATVHVEEPDDDDDDDDNDDD